MPEAPDLLASDGEREQTIDRLRVAAAEGRLTLDELADRVEATAAARTQGQLAELVADLPAPGGLAPAAGAAMTAVPTRNTAVFGDLVRRGAWSLPERSRWDTAFGDVKLDLREAVVAASVVTVRATTVFGDIDVIVPDGVVVEVRATATLGDIKQEAGAVAPAGAPRVILEGWTVFGDVLVRPTTRRRGFAERWLG
ncbi:MAG TPA: DUF1707 domain-containing protein [Capillimicrobium sp.]|jgi:hypothetical protein